MDLLWISKQYNCIKQSILNDKIKKDRELPGVCNDLMHPANLGVTPSPPPALMFPSPSLLCIYDMV